MMEYTGKKVTIMACSKCNINCAHCYISYKGNRTAPELLEMVKKLSKRYKIEINGAEILTEPAYLDAFEVVGQDFIMTNGLALYQDKDMLAFLKHHNIKKIFMSYHYGIQDDISVVSREQLESNIMRIVKEGFKLRLYTTITSSNYRMLHEMIEASKQYGAYSIRFTNYMRQGNALEMSDDNVMSDEQIKEFFEILAKERSQNDIHDFKITRCGTFGNGCSQNFRCEAGIDNVVLTPDNKVYPCIFLAKPGYEIGYYDGEKIMLFETPKNDTKDCVARLICNTDDKEAFERNFKPSEYNEA